MSVSDHRPQGVLKKNSISILRGLPILKQTISLVLAIEEDRYLMVKTNYLWRVPFPGFTRGPR